VGTLIVDTQNHHNLNTSPHTLNQTTGYGTLTECAKKTTRVPTF